MVNIVNKEMLDILYAMNGSLMKWRNSSKMKNIEVRTSRLLIKPRSLEEMQTLYLNENDTEMKQAYYEMIEGMKKNKGQEEWTSDWNIMLLSDMITVGGIGFKGSPNEDGIVEVGYGIDENYRRNGFATEALDNIVKWALSFPEVKAVQAQTEVNNTISQKVLLHNGFQHVGQGAEGPLFEIRKPDGEFFSCYL